MGRKLVGIALASVVVYLWGFLYWGASTLPYSTWKQTADDRAAGQAILEHFPESGVYYVPGNDIAPELRSELFESGPTGFVIVDVDGRPEFDTSIMAEGFALNVVVVALLALLLHLTKDALPTYGDRLKLMVVVAAVAVLMVNFGDAVWWALPWNWELAQAFYNFVGLVIGGAILAHFVREEADAR